MVRRLRDCFAYRRMRWADIKCEGCTFAWADCTCDAPVEKFDDHSVQWEHMLQHSSEEQVKNGQYPEEEYQQKVGDDETADGGRDRHDSADDGEDEDNDFHDGEDDEQRN